MMQGNAFVIRGCTTLGRCRLGPVTSAVCYYYFFIIQTDFLIWVNKSETSSFSRPSSMHNMYINRISGLFNGKLIDFNQQLLQVIIMTASIYGHCLRQFFCIHFSNCSINKFSFFTHNLWWFFQSFIRDVYLFIFKKCTFKSVIWTNVTNT